MTDVSDALSAPRNAGLSRVADAASLAAISAGAKRTEVEIMTRPLRRAAVCVGSVPRIDRKRVSLEIGTVPVVGSARFLHQRGEALLGARIRPDIEFVEIQHGADALDGLLGDGIARTGKLTQRGRCNEADEQAQDGD